MTRCAPGSTSRLVRRLDAPSPARKVRAHDLHRARGRHRRADRAPVPVQRAAAHGVERPVVEVTHSHRARSCASISAPATADSAPPCSFSPAAAPLRHNPPREATPWDFSPANAPSSSASPPIARSPGASRRRMHREGAELAFSYVNDKMKERVEPLAQSLGSQLTMPLDVTVDAQTDAAFERLKQRMGRARYRGARRGLRAARGPHRHLS